MTYRVPFGNTYIECETALEVVTLLHSLGISGEWVQENPDHGPWTDILLDTFLHALGPNQKVILGILVTQTRATAKELCAAVGAENNQALAGIISGISKQAEAMSADGIGPRDVFGIENSRKAGVLSKTFYIANTIQKVARAAGWPSAPENRSK